MKMPMNDPFGQKDPFKSGGGLQQDLPIHSNPV